MTEPDPSNSPPEKWKGKKVTEENIKPLMKAAQRGEYNDQEGDNSEQRTTRTDQT